MSSDRFNWPDNAATAEDVQELGDKLEAISEILIQIRDRLAPHQNITIAEPTFLFKSEPQEDGKNDN